MYMMRKTLSLVSVGAAAAALIAIPNSPASAWVSDAPPVTVSVKWKMAIHDEDGSVDDKRTFYGSVASFRVPPGPANEAKVLKLEKCVDEVRAVFHLYIGNNSNSTTERSTYTWVTGALYEGASCSTEDLDGYRVDDLDDVKKVPYTETFDTGRHGSHKSVSNTHEYDSSVPFTERDSAVFDAAITAS
ncbi:hypothetical protein ACIHFC_36630 [Streptomyces sp. NPDC052013]|uniref:hypothetical protein n=1 Tax=Streptomyces sp. NPDC052013 TaxID=3365679 RepID=UPI0037D21303